MTAGLLPWASSRASRLFWVLAASLLPFSIALPALTRQAILARQDRLGENAVWRALDALERGDLDSARRETARVLALVPERRLSGPIPLRFGVLPEIGYLLVLTSLAERLSARGLGAEARAVCWKALRLHHLEPRALEESGPWHVLARELGSDPLRSGGVGALLTAHGALVPKAPGQEAEPRGWMPRPPAGDAITLPLRGLPVETETMGPGRLRRSAEGRVDLFGTVAVEIDVVLPRAAQLLCLSAWGTSALGVFPILLATLDGGEPVPLYVGAREPRLYPLAGDLPAGHHTLRIEYINDFCLPAEPVEDRNVHLTRLVAFHSRAQ